MEELRVQIGELLEGMEGDLVVSLLATLLKETLDCAPDEETRLTTIDDITLYLKEPEYATQ